MKKQQKKRWIAAVMALCLLVSTVLMPVGAESAAAAIVTSEETEDGFVYLVDTVYEEVAITGYAGSDTEITIPDTIEGLPVTRIGEHAFSWHSSLTGITLPNSVTSIGNAAFDECDSLTSITLPDSITRIEDNAFVGCKSLTSITLPDSITDIGGAAFSGCKSLTSITLPDSITYIGLYMFDGCSSLTSITLPDSITYIGNYAFDGCSSLTSITLPDSITYIGDYAFCDCDSLTSITLPDSITDIRQYVFDGCSSLTSITLPDTITDIGLYAFSDCDALTDVFYGGCQKQWEKISIESGNKCLTNATVHYSECSHKNTEIQNVKSATCTEDGYTGDTVCLDCEQIIEKGTVTKALGHSYDAGTIIKQPTTTEEGIKRFTCTREGCTASYEEKIPKLPNTEKPSTQTSISKAKISGITNKNYTGKALKQSDLSVTLNGKKLNAKTDYTVSYKNNKNIGTASLTITGTGKYTGSIKKTFKITVAKGKTYTAGGMKYKLTNAALDGKGTVMLTGTTKKKTDSKFKALSIGSTVNIGGKTFQVTAVGDKAFRGYKKLTKVTFGKNLKTIGTQSFADCTGLSKVTLSDSITAIGKESFSGCTKMTAVTLGKKTAKIGEKAFYNCKKLKTITIKSTGLKSVGKNAVKNINKKAVIKVPAKKLSAYKKLFQKNSGYVKTMKLKKQ